MKLQLNGIEIEIPGDAKVDVSKDGRHVKIHLPEPKVIEKIRVVESEGAERIVEKIRVIETEKPCTLPHYPQTIYPNSYPWNQPNITWGTTTTRGSLIGGSTVTPTGNVTFTTTPGIPANGSSSGYLYVKLDEDGNSSFVTQ